MQAHNLYLSSRAVEVIGFILCFLVVLTLVVVGSMVIPELVNRFMSEAIRWTVGFYCP